MWESLQHCVVEENGQNDNGRYFESKRMRPAHHRRRWMSRSKTAVHSRVCNNNQKFFLQNTSLICLVTVPKVITGVADVADENRRNTDLTLNMPPISERISNLQKEKDKDNVDRNLLDISREASVKDLTERLQVIVKCNVIESVLRRYKFNCVYRPITFQRIPHRLPRKNVIDWVI